MYFNTSELLRKKGHDVYFFSMNHPDNIFSNLSNYFVPSHDYRNLPLIRKIETAPSFVYNKKSYNTLSLLLDKIKPDVAHLHLFLGGMTSSILKVLKKRKVPIVCSVHDYRLLCPAYLFLDGSNNICERCKDKFYFRCLIKRCSENNLFQSGILSIDAYFRKYFVNPIDYVDKYIFVCDFMRKKHISFNPAYAPKGQLLYNFIPDLDSTVTSAKKGEYLLFYGRLSKEKGLSTLIDATIKTNIKLKIVGTGPLAATYNYNINNRIQFLGYKDGEELWNLVRNASFIVVPSECYENNPLTILESYAYGKPVIGSKIGGMPEIIIDGHTGFLFESRNKDQLASTLLKADKLSDCEYKQFSNNARQFAEEHFHPIKHYNALIKIYEDTIKNNL